MNHYAQKSDDKKGSTGDDQISQMNQILNENTRRGIQKPLIKKYDGKLSFLSPEKSISSIDSLGMMDH